MNYIKEVQDIVRNNEKFIKIAANSIPNDKKTLNKLCKQLKNKIKIIKNENSEIYLKNHQMPKRFVKTTKYLNTTKSNDPSICTIDDTWTHRETDYTNRHY